jgi:lipopolysaccharide transport system permease protein
MTSSPARADQFGEEREIVAGRGGRRYLHDLWLYRELLVFLSWRDLLVRYKQTVAGVAWSVIRPLLTMLVLTLVFGKLGNMPSLGVPYPVMVFAGILPWQFFAAAVSESGGSLVANTGLISKVYFPRLVIPASALITSLADFGVSIVLLGALMAWFQWIPPATIVFLPVFIALASVLALGLGLWTSALMVAYRDVRFIVPFLVQFGLYISPVGFASAVVPDNYRLWYSLNPMVGVIDGFRWCILGGQHTLYWQSVIASVAIAFLTLLSGIWYFRRTERTFADII